MRVHHLNCGTMRTPGGTMVCHVLLVEAPDALVLVDTGFGLRDIAAPAQRLGPYRHLVRPVLEEDETALRQVQALGFEPREVRHIVLTHADFDHVGGLDDFPRAQVHLSAPEAAALRARGSRLERQRYRPAQWSTHPPALERLIVHPEGAREWLGLPGARALEQISPDLLLIPLPGHTAGHAGVAVRAGEGWVLHAGDAFGSPALLARGREPPVVRARQRLLAHDPARMRQTQDRLAALARTARERGEPVRVVTGHDAGPYRAGR